MKRILGLSLVTVALASAFAPTGARATDVSIDVEVTANAEQGRVWGALTSAAVAGNGGTASSNGYDLAQSLFFGLWLKCAGTTPDVKAEWLESPTKDSADFVSVVTAAANHTGASPLVYGISPPPMRYARLKLTGNAGNGANTTCTARVLIWAQRN